MKWTWVKSMILWFVTYFIISTMFRTFASAIGLEVTLDTTRGTIAWLTILIGSFMLANRITRAADRKFGSASKGK